MEVYYKPPKHSPRLIELKDRSPALLEPSSNACQTVPAMHRFKDIAGPSSQLSLDPEMKQKVTNHDDTGLDDLERNITNVEDRLKNPDTIIDMDDDMEDDPLQIPKIKAAGLLRFVSVNTELLL